MMLSKPCRKTTMSISGRILKTLLHGSVSPLPSTPLPRPDSNIKPRFGRKPFDPLKARLISVITEMAPDGTATMIRDLLTQLLNNLSREETIGLVEFVECRIIEMRADGLLNIAPNLHERIDSSLQVLDGVVESDNRAE